MSERLRLFFAIWPEEGVRHELAAVAAAAQAYSGGRAIPAEKIHLTLFFVGAIDRTRLEGIERAGASFRGRGFNLALERIGYFRRQGVVWAGTKRTPHALLELVQSLRNALTIEGVHGEDREYVPHVTLVRDARRRPADDVLTGCTLRAREFALVQSVSASGGVRYESRVVWPLEK